MTEEILTPLDPEKGEWDAVALSRRRFLEVGFFAAAGTLALTAGGLTTRFMVGDSLKGQVGQWVEVGLVSELVPQVVHKINFSFQAVDAWQTIKQTGTMYAFTEDGVNYTALDATCTHLGCLVRWQQENGRFACPCHEGIFNQEGEVLSGAPTKPLRRFTTKVENGVLFAQT